MAKKQRKIPKNKPKQYGNMYCGHSFGFLPILIIVLVWVSTATWSKVVITIAAALMILGKVAMHAHFCGIKKK